MNLNPSIEELIEVFEDAKEFGAKYVAIKVDMKGFDKPEIIINERDNIDAKLAYYKGAYDVDLVHRFSPGIRIVNYTYGDTFEEIRRTI